MAEVFSSLVTNTQIIGWAVAFVVFLIIEGITPGTLVSIWFAAAALFSMLAAIAGLGFVWQLAIFVAASIILLIVSRPLVKRIRKPEGEDPNENYDLGKTAVVVEHVCNKTGEGRVKLDGVDWAARSEDGGDIEEGAVVTVKQVDGTKLIVAR